MVAGHSSRGKSSRRLWVYSMHGKTLETTKKEIKDNCAITGIKSSRILHIYLLFN